MSRDMRTAALLEFLESRGDEGATMDDMCDMLGCNAAAVRKAIRDVRMFLGDSGDANLTCTPQGAHMQWRYHIVAKMEGHEEWVGNRIGDAEARIGTMHAILASAVRSTDGRTMEGKRARVMRKQLGRLLEDLQEVESF